MKVDVIMFVVFIAIGLAIGFNVFVFIKKNNEEKIKAVKEWLLFCVTKIESIYGGGTGKIKLRAAWDMAVTKFPFLTVLVTFDEFSEWVDEALEEMKKLLENSTIKYLVDNREI